MPTELDELRRKIQQLEIEEISLKKEDDTLSAQRLADLQKELAELKDKFNAQQAQWQNEKNKVDNLSKLREEKDAVKSQIEQAMQQGNYEKVSELQYGRLPQIVHEKVTEEEIARIVSKWTGIPVAKLTESERNKTLHLPEELHKRVLGQDEAVEKVSEAIMRSKAGIKDPTKPIGSLPVSAKPNSPKPSLRHCSTMKRTWSESICPNIWRNTVYRD